GDAERVEHVGEVNAGGRKLWVRKVDGVGRQQRGTQRHRVSDGRLCRAGAHRQARAHHADIDCGAWPHVARARQLANQCRRQNQQVGCGAGKELVAHGAHRAKGGGDRTAGLDLELGADAGHKALRSTGAQEDELHRLAPQPMAAMIRSRVMGRSRTRTPSAANMALPMAAALAPGVRAAPPAPGALSGGELGTSPPTPGPSEKRRIGWAPRVPRVMPPRSTPPPSLGSQLVVWRAPPSIWWAPPSGLMPPPPSTATT